MASSPTSPTSARPKSATSIDVIPLDSSLRTTPIHALLSSIKVPATAVPVNPLSLQPFTVDEVKSHNFVGLREQYSTPDAARRAQEETIHEIRTRLDENEQRTREIEREMEEKNKLREIERRVYKKKLGKDDHA